MTDVVFLEVNIICHSSIVEVSRLNSDLHELNSAQFSGDPSAVASR